MYQSIFHFIEEEVKELFLQYLPPSNPSSKSLRIFLNGYFLNPFIEYFSPGNKIFISQNVNADGLLKDPSSTPNLIYFNDDVIMNSKTSKTKISPLFDFVIFSYFTNFQAPHKILKNHLQLLKQGGMFILTSLKNSNDDILLKIIKGLNSDKDLNIEIKLPKEIYPSKSVVYSKIFKKIGYPLCRVIEASKEIAIPFPSKLFEEYKVYIIYEAFKEAFISSEKSSNKLKNSIDRTLVKLVHNGKLNITLNYFICIIEK